MLHIRRMGFRLRSQPRIFWIPPWFICSPLHTPTPFYSSPNSPLSLFYVVYTRVRFSLLPSLFVKQIYFFVLLRFLFAFLFSFRFLSFPSLPNFWQRLFVKLIPFGGLSTTVRSFLYLAVLFFYPLHLSPFENLKIGG